MLPGGMNQEFLGLDDALLTERGRRVLAEVRDQARRLGELSAALDCPILAGGTTLHRNPNPLEQDDRWLVRNSTLWFDRADRPSAIYSKMHLVPFSEYVPFKSSWPRLHRMLRRFVPPVMEQLDPGAKPAAFKLSRGGRSWNIASPICYEGTFAGACRDLVMQGDRKATQVLANLSNDGWFVWRWGQGPYHGSTEHTQHLVQYCFRAVETRTPVVRAVNTGISASIDSSGRIMAVLTQRGVAELACGTLLLDGALDQDGRIAPGHGPKLLVDDRITVYSLLGDAFAWGTCAAAAVCAGLLSRKRREEKGR
jgi:apolipoprotein N-acyltransferase